MKYIVLIADAVDLVVPVVVLVLLIKSARYNRLYWAAVKARMEAQDATISLLSERITKMEDAKLLALAVSSGNGGFHD